ncbi:MAG: DUF2029 domain-containing protein [Ktedonobacterales bacterium]|nr:DUF2029 domain-containing protein [Ktedonobacterales bacterium]
MQREETAAAESGSPIRVPSWAYSVVAVASMLIGAAAIVRGTRAVVTAADSDLTTFFFTSAHYVLRGDPFHIYAVNVGGYPNYNPPLSIFLMAPLLKLAELVGFDKNYGEQITFVALPFVVLVPFLGYLVVRTLRRLYPGIPEIQLLLAFVLVTLSPLTWQSIATWYHVEQPLMLCFLIGSVLLLRRQRPEWGGLLAGLAVLTRTTALMPLLALGVLLLVGREWRSLPRFALVGAGVVGVVMAPFFLLYPRETTYSLLSWRSGALIGGNTVWAIFGYSGDNAVRQLLDAVARRLDMYVVLLFIAVAAWFAARRLRISAFGSDAWAVMAIAALAVPMLSKTNWPYYYLEPFIFLLIWEFATMHDRLPGVWRWPVVAFSFLAVAATLSQYVGLKSVGYGDRVIVGVLGSGAMLAFVWVVFVRLGAKKPVATAAGLPGEAGISWQGRPFAPIAPALGTTARVPAPNLMPAPPSVPFGAPRAPARPLSPAPAEPRAPLWPPNTRPPDSPRVAPGQWSGGPATPGRGKAPTGGDATGSAEPWPDLWPDRGQGGARWNPER